ncbi:MAG: Cof-type HAD-IIB family hydrolase [Chloroflexota bacterium]
MKTSSFDLIVLDLDGTILNPQKATRISDAVFSVVQDLHRAGIRVTIGTGRTLDLMRGYAQQLGITLPVITTQGAVIAGPITGEIFSETLLPLTEARKVAAWVDESHFTTVFYFTDSEGHVTIYQNQMEGDSEFYDHVFGSPRSHQPDFSALLQGEDAHPPVKFITINDPASSQDITPELTERFSQLTITRTHAKLVEGTAKEVTKGAGLQKLCQILGVDPQRVMAIGDNDNDIPMLEAAGLGIAMGNASAGAKAVADWIAPTIEEDGVAVALRKWVL